MPGDTQAPQEPRGRQLTRKQREVLTAIQRFSALKGYMPSVRELGRELGGLAPATVQHHLSTLRRKGFLDHDGSAHGVRLAASPVSAAPAGIPLAFEKGDGPARSTSDLADQAAWDLAMPAMQVVVPLLGTLTGGQPLDAVDESDEYVPVPAALARGSAFALRVAGNAMTSEGIVDGDVLVIQPGESVRDGEVAVVLMADDSASVNRVFREHDGMRLQPPHASSPARIVTGVRVRGRVTGLIRSYD